MKRAHIDTRQNKSGELDVITWADEGDYMVIDMDEWIHIQNGYIKALATASQLRDKLEKGEV